MLGKALLFAGAATLTALLAAGCQGTASVSTGATTTTTAVTQSTQTSAPAMTTPPLGSGGATVMPTAAAGGQPTTTASTSQFANKTMNVLLTGYDSKTGMIQFQLAVHQSASTDDGVYVADPKNPGTHQLPMAPAASVLSAASFCPNANGVTIDAEGVGNGPCTVTQLIQAFQRQTGGLGAAQMSVDAVGHIVKIAELYHP